MDAWCDVSSYDNRTFGAFIIGTAPIETVELNGRLRGTVAEVALMEHVIETAQAPIVIHHDVAQLPFMIAGGRVRTLAHLASQHMVEFKCDGRNHKEYRDCHHAARVAVGIYGNRHPLFNQLRESDSTRARVRRLEELRRMNDSRVLKGGL